MATSANPFQRATKAKAKLRLAVIGPSGSGKTWSSLAIATRLAELSGGRVAVIDTERGSASLYSDRFDFDVLELSTFSPQQYMDAIQAADDAGYAVILIDSLSHAWAGPGGVLEFVDNTAKRQQAGNSFSAWRDGTKLQNQLVDAMLGSRAHLIVTMRSKQEYVQEKDDRGRTQIRKVGMQPVQRDGLDYEFTVTADMDTDHNFVIGKTRISSLTDRVVVKPDGKIADELHTWLESGESAPPPAPRQEPPAQQPRQMSQAAAMPAKRDREIVDFWMGVKNFAEQNPESGFVVDGKIRKAAVHAALGLPPEDGSLAAWVADGHTYEQAFTALKLGLPIVKAEPEHQGALMSVSANHS